MKKRTVWAVHILLLLLFFGAGVLFAPQLSALRQELYLAAFQGKVRLEVSLTLGSREPMKHTGEEWYQDTRLIYHAGGAVEGLDYTNSREALEATLARGGRVVELDFLFTADGELACGHTWQDLHALEPLTLEEFQNTKLYHKFTPMTAREALEQMGACPELYLVVDTKEEDPLAVLRELAALAGGDSAVLDRLVIQLYDRGMKERALEIYPFPEENFLFTVYKFGAGRIRDILELCVQEEIRVVTAPYNAWGEDTVRLFREQGIVVFLHTVNDPSQAQSVLAQGVQGLYTDRLWPEDLE